MVITGTQKTRLELLDQLSWDLIKFSYAPASLKNLHSHKKRYLDFCTVFNLCAFPVNQWQLVRFATFLSFHFRSPKAVENYVATICTLNELGGYGKVVKGLHLRKCLMGIKRKMKHRETKAKPLTFEMFHKMLPLVNFNSDKQLVCWVALVFAFHLFMRKSNLVPESRCIDDEKQFQRRDFRHHKDVMLADVKWAKNRQFGERLLIPIVRNTKSTLCPFYWFMYMVDRIPAPPDAPAFCYQLQDLLVPITYQELMAQMRIWLMQIGEDGNRFGLHSARRGGASAAFRAGLPFLAIQTLGDWGSQVFLKYIDITLDTRLKASILFSLQDRSR